MTGQKNNLIPRPPVVVVMGHIDHGKSALLDYVRKTSIVQKEVGGITQYLSAYEVEHPDQSGVLQKITFLDTPGHEAFQKMRSCGSQVADVAILVVSAEEGAKAQTLEALSSIRDADIPFIVAITKIDKPNADIEHALQSLSEHEVYLEKRGGSVPWVPLSSKSGEGIPELLELVLLCALMEELTGNPRENARGTVIEANRDPQKGISATFIISDGTLKVGMYLAVGGFVSPIRSLENFMGDKIQEATFSSPVRIAGLSQLPAVGSLFYTAETKKEAEELAQKTAPVRQTSEILQKSDEDTRPIIPIVIKADALGTLEAIQYEISKLPIDRVDIRIVGEGIGDVSESDVKKATTSKQAMVLAFNVGVDSAAQELARRDSVEIVHFNIIYKLTEWLTEAIVARTPKEEVREVKAKAKILKTFSSAKNMHIIGGRLESGILSVGDSVTVLRNDEEIGMAKIAGLQQQKVAVKKITEGNEFGAKVSSTLPPAAGDYLVHFIVSLK